MGHYIRPVSRARNYSVIAFIVVTNSFGNLMLALGVKHVPAFDWGAVVPFMGAVLLNPWIIGGTAVMALWMFAQLSMLSWSDLSYVLPVTATGYILTALLGTFLLNETTSPRHWAGIALISFGVLFVAETAPKTVHNGDAQ